MPDGGRHEPYGQREVPVARGDVFRPDFPKRRIRLQRGGHGGKLGGALLLAGGLKQKLDEQEPGLKINRGSLQARPQHVNGLFRLLRFPQELRQRKKNFGVRVQLEDFLIPFNFFHHEARLPA